MPSSEPRSRLTPPPERRYTASVTVKSTIQAPAKLNLYLAIGARRQDGYHPIASLFQAVSLADEVVIEASDRPGVRILGDSPCRPEDNTAFKAAEAMLGALRESGAAGAPGFDVRIAKRIPSQAGLGGASSDAAAVLRLLSGLYGGMVPAQRLRDIAASVGSDVPFFLGTACAKVYGRGEVLDP